jgi:hypothetical protein
LISLMDKYRLQRVLGRMLDETEFLSPYGLRSLSRYHREHPLIIDLDGHAARLDYEPAESRTALFGGNSNWRGPIWLPLNFLAIESFRYLHASFSDEFTVELPTGSGVEANLEQVADELERRLLRLFLRDAGGRRPALGSNPRFQRDGAWRDCLLFHEYFHGDTGEGLGASHQTGWTALVGALVANRRLRQAPLETVVSGIGRCSLPVSYAAGHCGAAAASAIVAVDPLQGAYSECGGRAPDDDHRRRGGRRRRARYEVD